MEASNGDGVRRGTAEVTMWDGWNSGSYEGGHETLEKPKIFPKLLLTLHKLMVRHYC